MKAKWEWMQGSYSWFEQKGEEPGEISKKELDEDDFIDDDDESMQEDSYSSDEKMDNESKVGGKWELSL